MRHDSLDQCLFLSTHDSPLNHFRPLQVAPCLLQKRQGPNCKLLCGAAMVRAQDTWFVRRSDSQVLTFWRLELSLNEHDVAPTGLYQPMSDFS